MPAAVETYKDMAAFASLRQPAWHGLGTVFDKPVSTREMLSLAHMDNWNLRLRLLETDAYSDKAEFEVLRDNPFMKRIERLGIVGKRYNLFDNESIFNFGDEITDSRRRWETAGSLDGGRKVFATMVATDDLVLDPNGSNDVIKRYIMLVSSHDGSTTMIIKMVNTRVVCQNTLNVALKEAGAEFRIRHTDGMETKIRDTKQALALTDIYNDEFDKEAQAFFEKEMTLSQFEKIVFEMFPEPDEDNKAGYTRWDKKMDRMIHDMWRHDKTGSVGNLPNNAWKGFQVITEHGQWDRLIREDGSENFLAAGAGFEKRTNDLRNEAFGRIKEFVTA